MDIFKELKRVENTDCLKGCNQEKRGEIAENDICKKVESAIDQLPVRCVGEWAFQKIYLLAYYFGIFSQAMKNKWPGGINYIEICSGPGRCINRENGEEFNGTALAIIEHATYTNIWKAFFFDADCDVVDSLNSRILSRNIKNAKAILGDYNNDREICNRLTNEIPKDSLNLIFIDPTDCGIPFQLIRSLKTTVPNVDLIINVASKTDFNRNIKSALLDQKKYKISISKYSRFLDGDRFFKDKENIKLASLGKSQELRSRFREIYKINLEKLGFQHFNYTPVNGFYDLLFATGHEIGLEFWLKAKAIGFNGQRTLF